MKIAEVRLEPCVLRKHDPNWRFARGASPVTEGVIVTLTGDDGTEAYGYASATPHMGATRDTLLAALNAFVPLISGQDSFDLTLIMQRLNRVLAGQPQAKAAVDCALHDLNAKLLGVPLYQLFGGKLRDSLPILRILAIKTPADMALQAETLVNAGYHHLKIKVEGDVVEDVARVAAVRERVGAAVHLTIDANQAYTVKDAISALNRMAVHNIDLAEQPVAASDFAGLKVVTDSVDIAVEADESADSIDAVFRLVSERIVDSVSLKIPKLGGLRNTLAAAQICEAGQVACRMGAAVGSRLLSAHALHFAAALPVSHYACELGEFDRLSDDPFTGIEIESGCLRIPDIPGCGVVPRRDEAKAALA
jgi:L-alanine-DL-glutamate epimerase-like enolase superfamily enzyme